MHSTPWLWHLRYCIRVGASVVGVLAFGLSSPARAAGLFVSTTGDDGASGAIATPWRSVASSVARLAPGDTLYLRGGQYFESVHAAVSGTSGAAIVIRSCIHAMATSYSTSGGPPCRKP